MSAKRSGKVRPARQGQPPGGAPRTGGAPPTGGADSASSFQPWHLFVLLTLAAATAGAVMVRGSRPANVVFICLAIGSAGVAAFAFYRMLWPLAAPEGEGAPEMVGGRTRAALEREKTLVLKAIKELEFDRAMGKVSEADRQEMTGRLRARAVRLIKQLDEGSAAYRELIERELAARRRSAGLPATPPAAPDPARAATMAARGAASAVITATPCSHCGAANDPDAQFCKRCGIRLTIGTE